MQVVEKKFLAKPRFVLSRGRELSKAGSITGVKS